MRRRTALASLASVMLAACGGGGGGGGTAPAGLASAGNFSGPSSIALWGDSMVPPVAREMQLQLPGREVFDGGIPGETSVEVLARRIADATRRDWVNIFWFGHNNVRLDAPNAAARVLADMAAAVGQLVAGNNRFLVLSLNNNAALATQGTAEYDLVLQINSALAAAYPSNYLDIRSFMVAQSSAGDPQGASDLANDVPATALRWDEIHLSPRGAEVVAARLKRELENRGW